MCTGDGPLDLTLLEDASEALVTLATGRFERLRVSEVTIGAIRIIDSTFAHCDFQRVNIGFGLLGGSESIQTTYTNCVFVECDLAGLDFGSALFEQCQFSSCNLRSANVRLAEFVKCTFSGTVEQLVFSRTIPRDQRTAVHPRRRRENRFYDNDFRDSSLIDVSFAGGINLDAQQLPPRNEFVLVTDWRRAVLDAERAIRRSSDATRRDDYVRVLEILDRTYAGRRGSVFISKLGRPSVEVEVLDMLDG